MPAKLAKADITPVRQRTQFSCLAASMSMALKCHGQGHCDEDTVNKVMGAQPMRGASWEQALACAQHYGMRGTLTSPCTLKQLKAWTDAGVPVLIAWNPEGREWSHASVVFDVDEDENVHVADPNIPDPEQTVRVVPKSEFYAKWYEKWPKYLVRRPAMAIEREITQDGRQVMAADFMAGKKELRSQKDKGMARFLKQGPVRPTEKSDAAKAMSKAHWEALKSEGRAGLPGSGLGAGYHKDKSRYDRGEGKRIEREAGSLTQPLMTRRDYGAVTASDYASILKYAVDLPPEVEEDVKEIQKKNPDYTEGQAWATAWSIHCKHRDPGSEHCQMSPSEYFKAAKFPAGVTMTVDEVAEVVGPEFKEMNEDPPESVVKVREEMQGKTASWRYVVGLDRRGAVTVDSFHDPTLAAMIAAKVLGVPTNSIKYQERSPTVVAVGRKWSWEDLFNELAKLDDRIDAQPNNTWIANVSVGSIYEKSARTLMSADMFAEMLRDGKFEKGKSMTVDEVAEVVGPEFKEMNEDPPASVVKLREEMTDKTAANPKNPNDPHGIIGMDVKAADGGNYGHRVTGYDPEAKEYLVTPIRWSTGTPIDPPTEINDYKITYRYDVKNPRPSPVRVAASGLYGFTRDVEGACQGACKRLGKAADRIARALYGRAADSPSFLTTHATRAGSKTASMLLKAMESIGPMAQLNKTASQKWKIWTGPIGVKQVAHDLRGVSGVSNVVDGTEHVYFNYEGDLYDLAKDAPASVKPFLKGRGVQKMAGKSGNGLYGFSEKTAKLGLQACSDLHHEAGVIAADLFARKGSDPVKVAGYLTANAKKGKCAFSEMLAEVAPDVNAMVIDKLAASKKKPAKPDTDFVVEEDDGIWAVIGKPSKYVYSAHGSEAEAEKAKDEWLDAIPAKKKASLVERLAAKIAADFMASDETADDELVDDTLVEP